MICIFYFVLGFKVHLDGADDVKPNPWAYSSCDDAPKSKGTDKRNLLGTGNYQFPELHEREKKRMTIYARASMMTGRNSTMNSGRASSRGLKF